MLKGSCQFKAVWVGLHSEIAATGSPLKQILSELSNSVSQASLPPLSRLERLGDHGHTVACPQEKHVPLAGSGQEVVLALHDSQLANGNVQVDAKAVEAIPKQVLIVGSREATIG